MNREMLKECIADAKTIRESAIANAKLALEEAFTPQLTAMFAERLNELELEESEATKEPVDEYSMEEETITVDETFNLEELLAELEMEEGQDLTMEGDDTEESSDEDLMFDEMSDAEIEKYVTKVIDDMIASGKIMAGEEAEDEDMDDMDDMDDMGGEEEDEDINLEELLAEINSEEVKEQIGVEGDVESDVALAGITITGALITLAYKLAAAKDKAEREKIMADIKKKQDELTSNIATQAKASVNITADQAAEIAKKGKGMLNTFLGKIKSFVSENEEDATTEMEETINELRNELNEVNLLNAKLLYTNKIFKSKNLTESEKIKVLNTFDKAETVKEVKLVFETLTESFKAITAKKNPIKESLGSASKTISTATPKQPIIESNEAFARMQRLAGLRK